MTLRVAPEGAVVDVDGENHCVHSSASVRSSGRISAV